MDNATSKEIELSIIITISKRFDPISELFHDYKRGAEATGMVYEFIYVLDGEMPDALEELIRLQKTEKLKVLTLAKWLGEAADLSAAFSKASGNIFFTLPAYQQVEIGEIPILVASLENCDMVLARRFPQSDSIINRLQARLFNFLLRFSTDLQINDADCSVRVFTRNIIEEVQLYGDLRRFFPVMAYQQGFRVIEIDVVQAKKDLYRRIYSPGIYLRRLLDLLTIFSLMKSTKKPLRFFGLVDSTLFSIGLIATL